MALQGNESNDQWDLIGTLESLIDSATASVDLCIYDLEHPRIGRALVQARERGVRVRLVTDNYNRTDAREVDDQMWQICDRAASYPLMMMETFTRRTAALPTATRTGASARWIIWST